VIETLDIPKHPLGHDEVGFGGHAAQGAVAAKLAAAEVGNGFHAVAQIAPELIDIRRSREPPCHGNDRDTRAAGFIR